MTLILPGSPEYADAARQLPRQYREPLPIPDDGPNRATQSYGTTDADWSAWYADPATGWPTRSTYPAVNERAVTGIPAAWRCVTFLSNAVASCAPPIEFNAQSERVEPLSPVVERPWAFLTAHEFWAQAATTALLYGNFVGLRIDVDPVTGYARQVMPVHPNDVGLVLVDGLPVYGWGGEAFGWDEVVHVRGYTSPGSLWGLGVIAAFRLALAGLIALGAYGSSTYANAAENSVVIQVDRPELSETQAQAIQTAWVERHASGTRRPAVIPRSMTITPLAFSPADAQFLESQQLAIADVAFMFGLDPTDLTATVGGGGALTYANREQREIERLTHSVGPWLRRFEQSWADLLPGRRSMAFNVERLLRTDTSTRIGSSAAALAAGIFTLDDARAVERLPLYGEEWSAVPFGRPPAPTPEPGPVDAPAPGSNGAEPDRPTSSASTAEAV